MVSFTQRHPFTPAQCPWTSNPSYCLHNDCSSAHKAVLHSLRFSDAGELMLEENTW